MRASGVREGLALLVILYLTNGLPSGLLANTKVTGDK